MALGLDPLNKALSLYTRLSQSCSKQTYNRVINTPPPLVRLELTYQDLRCAGLVQTAEAA